MFAKLKNWLHKRKHRRQYVYGYVFRDSDGYRRENVRLNKSTKRIEFILYKAGEQGHVEDYWYTMGYKWDVYFVAYENR